MVHQHFRLVRPLSVAENIILGSEKSSFWLNKKKIKLEIDALSKQYGLAIDAEAKIWQLSVGEQQRVEIVKILFRGSDILILDEPTAVLTPQESCDLFATLRRMAEAGKAVIVITHKMLGSDGNSRPGHRAQRRSGRGHFRAGKNHPRPNWLS